MTELSSQLHLHELQLTPELGLHKVASLPCPELGCKPGQLQQQSAAWAPDDSALLLRYHVTDQADSRGSFEVRSAASWPWRRRCALHGVQGKSLTDS